MLIFLPVIFAGLFIVLIAHTVLNFNRVHVRAVLKNSSGVLPYKRFCSFLGWDNLRFIKIKGLVFFAGCIATVLSARAPTGFVLTFYPSVLGFVIPDLILFGRYGLLRVGRRKEIEFLKRLFLLNGNLQPVVFEEILAVLKENSRYLFPLFETLERRRSQNTADLRRVYENLGDQYGELEIRLFLEKMYHADCLDFQQGVESLKMDQLLHKMNRKREAEKTRTLIELFGLTFAVLLAGLLAYYLLLPWISIYSLQTIR